MKFSVSRLAFIFGAFILGLIAIDGLVQLNREAYAGFGMGTSHWVAADSAMALFLVGLVAGIVLDTYRKWEPCCVIQPGTQF